MFSLLKIISNPKFASIIASLYIGRPDLADDMIDICERESKCTDVKTHKRDAHISRKEWKGQISLGHLDENCQDINAKGGWATHSPWGVSAGAHWAYVPPCYQPSDFDNVFAMALLSVRKYERECWETNTRHLIRGWCRVSKKSRKNNLPSPKLKQKRKIDPPKNWVAFYFVKK